jgi:hypothetical protein
MNYIPGIIAYFVWAYSCWVIKIFVFKIASHWAKVWVGDAPQADSQILALSFSSTALIVGAVAIFLFSIANHINFKFSEKSLLALAGAACGFALAIGADGMLNELASKLTYAN